MDFLQRWSIEEEDYCSRDLVLRGFYSLHRIIIISFSFFLKHLITSFNINSMVMIIIDHRSLVIIRISLGNANLVYTIIRKRQVFFALSNLSTDTQTVAKLSTRNSNASSTSNKKPLEDSVNKQTVFQTTSKSITDDEPPLNRDFSPQSKDRLPGTITNSMVTTLVDTPCKDE